MMGDVAPCPALPIPRFPPAAAPPRSPESQARRIVIIPVGVQPHQVEKGADVALLEKQATVHIGFAQFQCRVESRSARCRAVGESNYDRRSDPSVIAIDMAPTSGVDNRQAA